MNNRDVAIVSEVMMKADTYAQTHHCRYGQAVVNLMPQRIIDEDRQLFRDVFYSESRDEAVEKLVNFMTK